MQITSTAERVGKVGMAVSSSIAEGSILIPCILLNIPEKISSCFIKADYTLRTARFRRTGNVINSV